MAGEELERILSDMKIRKSELARILGVQLTQVNQVLNVKDVKTGYLEKLCDSLGLTIDNFYKGTKYSPFFKSQETGGESKAADGKTEDSEEEIVDISIWKTKYEEEKAKKHELEGKYAAMSSAYNMLLNKITEIGSKAV